MSFTEREIQELRSEFPILTRQVHGKPLVYLDNAATLQKPKRVLDALTRFYSTSNANVHRGVHTLSCEATDAYEGVRPIVRNFLGSAGPDAEIIFTRGTTDGLNLVASSLGELLIQPGNLIVVTRAEHHGNFVPWQALAHRKNARFEIAELNSDYRLDYNGLKALLAKRPKIVALSLMSNVTGAIERLKEAATLAHEAGAAVVVDAAQAAAHFPIRLTELGPIDFLAFSGHKIGAPTGIGVLWGKKSWLEKMPPYQFGGDMIRHVGDQTTQWNELPWKFEAGTPNFADAIAMGEAIQFLTGIGMDKIQKREHELLKAGFEVLKSIPGVEIFGPPSLDHRGSVLSFSVPGVHPHDLATFLDVEGIAVRAGHHCAQPLLNHYKIPALIRASLSFYNTFEEVEFLGKTLRSAQDYFSSKNPSKERRGDVNR